MFIYIKNLKSSTDFQPENYCLALSEHFWCDYKKLIDIFYKYEKTYKNILYPDTITTLEKLKEKYILGIFSEGYKRFQLTKLKFSGILPYFDRKYIFLRRRKLSKKFLGLIPANSIIIDDNKKVIDILTKNNIKNLWVDRSKSIKQNNILSVLDQSSL
jgi:FMN phosphatase YigB (HAD superfamily)